MGVKGLTFLQMFLAFQEWFVAVAGYVVIMALAGLIMMAVLVGVLILAKSVWPN